MSHSPEPWSIDESDIERILAGSSVAGPCAIVDAKGDGVVPATPWIPSGFDMQRIVACVNFCRGIPTEWLQGRFAQTVTVSANERPEDGWRCLAGIKNLEGLIPVCKEPT